MSLRRVLVLADESVDWVIAGLRQLDRIALSIDEFAVDNDEKGPVLVCILWRADLEQSQRWIPVHPRLTHLAFTTDLEAEPYDLVLDTRLFVYRKAIKDLIESRPGPASATSWENYVRLAEPVPPARARSWEYIRSGSEIDRVEAEFLRASGKSQDGFVSRYLNRPISRLVTRFLLRHPITPNDWTWLLSPVPLIAALLMARGNYWSFVWGLVLFQIFSILDGCDGEIARAKFMESERGRRLDDLFDVLSNIFLALGLGVGLRHAHPHFGGLYLAEGLATALLIVLNEWCLAKQEPAGASAKPNSLGETLYPRHREMIARSGLLKLGEGFASALIQSTKRDVAVLFFVVLAVVGWPALILHLLFVVTAITLGIALGGSRAPSRD
ncbi:MAG: CDP-alcohol phosphatidyltransferase family protein [Chthoniobacterales bacterium]